MDDGSEGQSIPRSPLELDLAAREVQRQLARGISPPRRFSLLTDFLRRIKEGSEAPERLVLQI